MSEVTARGMTAKATEDHVIHVTRCSSLLFPHGLCRYRPLWVAKADGHVRVEYQFIPSSYSLDTFITVPLNPRSLDN